jgi:hypothetical protein
VEPTCEGKAALAEWNRHAAAVNVARDTLLNASNWLDKADPHAVIDALNACVGAADAMARLYHPKQPRPRDLADALARMRPWFERQKLPLPASIGDGFRSIADALNQSNLLRQDRKALYDQAAVFAMRESELATELARDSCGRPPGRSGCRNRPPASECRRGDRGGGRARTPGHRTGTDAATRSVARRTPKPGRLRSTNQTRPGRYPE